VVRVARQPPDQLQRAAVVDVDHLVELRQQIWV
jgi:hypothetical protein